MFASPNSIFVSIFSFLFTSPNRTPIHSFPQYLITAPFLKRLITTQKRMLSWVVLRGFGEKAVQNGVIVM